MSQKEWTEFRKMVKQGAKAMGTPLHRSQIGQFSVHAKELLEWNRFANLTTIVDPKELAEKHFLDTLPLEPVLSRGARVLDIGSGGGFPGIPLKVIRPDLHVTLIDGSRKKVHFLKYLMRAMELTDMEAYHVRTEELVRKVEMEEVAYEVIISKAVFKLDRFLQEAMPLLGASGVIIAMKGVSVDDEVETAMPRIESEGLTVERKGYRLPLLGTNRTLVILRKV